MRALNSKMDTGKTPMLRFQEEIKMNASSLICSHEYSKALNGFLNRVMKVAPCFNGLSGMWCCKSHKRRSYETFFWRRCCSVEFVMALLKVNRCKWNGARWARSFIKNEWSSNAGGDEIPGLWNAKPQPFPLRLGFLLSLSLSLFLAQSFC